MKRCISVFFSLALVFSMSVTSVLATSTSVSAPIDINIVQPRASLYLDSYSVYLGAHGNGLMSISMDITATGVMSKVGVNEIYIEKKVNGVWMEHDTMYSVYNSDFFQHNTRDFVHAVYFNGTVGVKYRVTIWAHARNASGGDSGTVTSYTVTCY